MVRTATVSILVLCLTVLAANALPKCLQQPEFNDVRTRVDEYVDLILATLRQGLTDTGYSQIQLPNATSSFSETFFGIKWNGEASAYNGWLKGVQSIQRTGPASITVNERDITFSVDVGFQNMYVSYDLKAKFMGLGPSAKASGRLDRVECYLSGKTSLFNPRKVSLERLELHDIGELSLDIEGLGILLDLVSAAIAERLGNTVKGVVAQLVENQLKDKLNEIIASTSLPWDVSSCIERLRSQR